MSPKDVKRTEQPHDRLTRLAGTMSDALKQDAEYRDGEDKAIICLNDSERGGICLHGYNDADEARDALVDLLFNIQASLQAHGVDMRIVPVNRAEG